jgi:hypothetical protein
MILTNENHPYGCEYEPAVVMIRQRVGDLYFTLPMSGERCKWCREEFVSAKLLNELDEDFSQSLMASAFDHTTNTQRWTFSTPAIHPHDDFVSTTIDDIRETRSSVIKESNYFTATTTS